MNYKGGFVCMFLSNKCSHMFHFVSVIPETDLLLCMINRLSQSVLDPDDFSLNYVTAHIPPNRGFCHNLNLASIGLNY